MARAVRPARLLIVIAAALLAAYAVLWSQVTTAEIGRSDFTSTYVGASLLRTGHAGELYDESAQAPLHAALIAPDHEGNLPFVDAPLAAALAAPVTLLPLTTAYWVWSALQLLVLLAAIVVAVRAAPWPAAARREWKLAAGMLALAGAGTMVQLLQAQWAPLPALGLALAYRDWRQGRDARGAALLVVAAAVAKPHLAVGLLAFMAGWRQRRVIAGALAGGVASAAASLAVAGPAGIAGFFSLAIASNTRWQLRSFSSFVGIPGSFLGNSAAAQMIGVAGSVAALGAAFALGAMVRKDRHRLDAALACATLLSLLAAPHVGTHDLVLLAPPMAWTLALGLSWDAKAARGTGAVIAAGAGLAVTAAAVLSLADGAAPQLTPWALIVAALLAWRAATATGGALRVRSPADATALGPVADGVRGWRGAPGPGLLPVRRRSA